MRVDMLIIVSKMAVDLLKIALTDTICAVLTNIGVGVLFDVNVTVLSVVMTADFEFDMSGPLEEIRC